MSNKNTPNTGASALPQPSPEREEKIKALAYMKKELEQRVTELQRELEKTKLLINLIDKALSEQSFTPASELQKQAVPQAPAVETVAPQSSEIEEIIKAKDNSELGKMLIGKDSVRVIPYLRFDDGIPPFKSFLIARILNGIRENAIASGKKESEAPSYEIIKDANNNVKELIIRNIDTSNERTMRELRNGISWTLKRIQERLSANSQ
jgi:hypothetical protein